MDDGDLTYTEANARPGLDRSWIVFTSWCNYKQVEWHVETSHHDDVVSEGAPSAGHGAPSAGHEFIGVLVYAITGCII
jgi:hypothetical protein